jgi:hypothetical protein
MLGWAVSSEITGNISAGEVILLLIDNESMEHWKHDQGRSEAGWWAKLTSCGRGLEAQPSAEYKSGGLGGEANKSVYCLILFLAMKNKGIGRKNSVNKNPVITLTRLISLYQRLIGFDWLAWDELSSVYLAPGFTIQVLVQVSYMRWSR